MQPLALPAQHRARDERNGVWHGHDAETDFCLEKWGQNLQVVEVSTSSDRYFAWRVALVLLEIAVDSDLLDADLHKYRQPSKVTTPSDNS